MNRGIDLNCDLGEVSYYKLSPVEKNIFKNITSANIACGFHAGDPLTMLKMVVLCKEYGVQVGAHPGYPDPMGFGRREMEISPEELNTYLLYQWGALDYIARFIGVKVKHIKLHGAFYNKVAKDELLSREVFRVIDRIDKNLILVAPCASVMYQLAKECGIRVAEEVFADRAYSRNGMLVPRSKPGAVIDKPQQVVERVLSIVRGEITADDGYKLEVNADTICLHGDTGGAVELAGIIKNSLEKEGIPLVPLDNLI